MAMPKGLSPAERKAYEACLSQSSYSDSWSPKGPGDLLIGKLLAVREFETKYGDARAMDIDTDDGVLSVMMGTVLSAAYDKLKPKVGQRLMILFRGEQDTGKGNPAKLYSLSLVK